MLLGIYLLTLPLICLCSKVIDEYSQKAVIVSDYCPSVPGCPVGTHVMCLHYNPNKVMGPACMNSVNISFTTELVQLVVDICNRIRSKVANGLGKGGDDIDLPRGYGLLRLSWDPELATLAQVWANQCILSLDFCRSTKRFPTVGQMIGMNRFTVKDWMPVSSNQKFNSTTITADKIRFVITTILKAWYEKKNEVTLDMVNELDEITNKKPNQFLQLVSGRSSHMGCGLSAYREYSYSDNFASMIFNSIQIVCNFSFRPRVGDPVYTISPPTEPGYTLKCGCPLGFDEDEDCLCYKNDRKMPYNCNEGRCMTPVVVLPIFTVEDAPLNNLRQNNISRIIESTAIPRHEVLERNAFKDYTRSIKNNVQIIKQESGYKTRRISTDVKNRYFGVNSRQTNKLKTKPPQGKNNHGNIHKKSIFAKAEVFKLPSTKIKQVVHDANYKKDVIPRKDFSKVQKLVSIYLTGRRIGRPLDKSLDNKNLTYIKTVTIGPYSSPNKFNNKVNNLDTITKHKFTYTDLNSTRTPSPRYDIKSLYEENDQIFMNLLDKLEEEVNNLDFNTKEKDIFDEKIRKIYGTLVKKSVVTEHSMVNRNLSMNKEVIDDNNDILNNINRKNYMLNPNNPNEYTYANLEERSINEKSMKKYYDKIEKKDNSLSYRSEPSYNQNLGERDLRNMHSRKKSHLNSMPKENFRRENYYLKSDLDEFNSFESNRRRHYYDKLNNLQRKISMVKKHGRQNLITEDRHLRPVRPSKHGSVRRSRPKEMDLYMSNRARFVHGF